MPQKSDWDKEFISNDSAELRLFNLHDYNNLPEYKTHNSLTNALASAELLLAQIEQYQPKQLRHILV